MSDKAHSDPVPALAKINRIREARGLSVNAFEREVGLGAGVGSRILRAEYRPSAPVLLRVRLWSRGEVDLPDWLTPDELRQANKIKPRRPQAAQGAA